MKAVKKRASPVNQDSGSDAFEVNSNDSAGIMLSDSDALDVQPRKCYSTIATKVEKLLAKVDKQLSSCTYSSMDKKVFLDHIYIKVKEYMLKKKTTISTCCRGGNKSWDYFFE
jgi:hypothetical protein